MDRQTSFVAALVIAISASSAGATDTARIGTGEGSYSATKSCPTGYALIGLEVKFGTGGIGKLRGVCREFSGSARWQGRSRMTSWTSTSGNTQSTMSSICPTHQVATGYYGGVTGDNVRYLKLECRRVAAGGGGGEGTPSESHWAGKPATSDLGPISCPDGEAASGFRSRGDSVLHQFGLRCAPVALAGSGEQDYGVTGDALRELERLAADRNLIATCQMITQPLPLQRCFNELRRFGVNMVSPTPFTSRFDFFHGGGSLRSGWRIVDLTAVSKHPECQISRKNPPGPGYVVTLRCPRGWMTGEVTKVVLRGPAGRRWQDAF